MMILFVLAAAAVLAVVAVVLCYRGTLYTSPEERRIRSLKDESKEQCHCPAWRFPHDRHGPVWAPPEPKDKG